MRSLLLYYVYFSHFMFLYYFSWIWGIKIILNDSFVIQLNWNKKTSIVQHNNRNMLYIKNCSKSNFGAALPHRFISELDFRPLKFKLLPLATDILDKVRPRSFGAGSVKYCSICFYALGKTLKSTSPLDVLTHSLTYIWHTHHSKQSALMLNYIPYPYWNLIQNTFIKNQHYSLFY